MPPRWTSRRSIWERVLEILQPPPGRRTPRGAQYSTTWTRKEWLALGCIIFSQYYDTARWVGELISATHPTEPVAVYAGVGKSGVLLDGEWRSIDREDIKRGVKERKFRVVCATDAALRGSEPADPGFPDQRGSPLEPVPARAAHPVAIQSAYGSNARESRMANLSMRH